VSATQTGVVGGGTMGSGIAHVLLASGADVTLVESDTARHDRVRDAVASSLAEAARRGKLSDGAEPGGLLERLTLTAALADLPAAADLVVEAVPEQVELKSAVLGEVAAACPEAVLATNTSSLSVGRISEGLQSERVLGMHFFNPVPAQKLVEIVVAQSTADATTDRARAWVERLGKTAIVVADSPGFATSRLGLVVGLEAIRMVEEGVGSVEDIDTGMKLGYRWPTGPLELTDMVGLDVRLAIAEHLARELGERFAPPQLLRDKVERGELGRKSGQGFCTWD
jgi:3-hydroxybutyryl-CoA dehydrogenase